MYKVIPVFLPTQVIKDAIEENYEEESKVVLENQYEKLKEIIPNEWIQIIEEKIKTNDRMVVSVKINDEQHAFNDLKLNFFYSCLCKDVFIEPKAEKYWKRLYPNMETKELWQNLRLWWKSPDLENFDYMLRQNCLLTEMRLCKIGISGEAKCKVCNREDEGILHLFFKCIRLKCFIKKLKEIVRKLGVDETIVDLNWETIFLFGFKGKVNNVCFLNLILTVARLIIWRRRNIVKEKKKNVSVCKLFKQRMCFILQVLFDYFKMEAKEEVFNKKFVQNNPFIENTWFNFNITFPECDSDCF